MRFKERDTNILYDVQFGEDEIIVRPAGDHPLFGHLMELLSLEEFEDRFEEATVPQ